MSSTAETAVTAPTPTVKMPVLPLLMSVLVAVLVAVAACAGGLYYMTRSGRLGAVNASAPSAAAAPVVAIAVPTKNLPLEPILANLSDADGHAYLRLGITLEVLEEKAAKKEEKEAKGPNPLEAGLRDTVLGIVGREDSASLLAVTGKEELKKKLMTGFAEHNAEAHVHEIFFTDFLVQR